VAGGIGPILDRKKWRSIGAIEKKHEALFGGLGYCIYLFAVPRHGEEHWRRRKIPIPQIMFDALKMPEPLACLCVQREQAIGEKIVAQAVAPVKIECCRTSGNVQNAAFGIESHASPIVCGAARFPG